METWGTIAAVLGAIVLIGNAVAVFKGWLKPAKDFKIEVEEHAARIASLEKHADDDLHALQHLQEMNRLQMRAMLNLINHQIDGNGIESMKETRDDIQELLIKM